MRQRKELAFTVQLREGGCVCCSKLLHVDRSWWVSAVENEGQNVSRTALFLGVDMVRDMWMAYGQPEAAGIGFQLGGLCLVSGNTLSRQGANEMFKAPG